MIYETAFSKKGTKISKRLEYLLKSIPIDHQMKNDYRLVGLIAPLLFIALVSSAQSYHPMLRSDVLWEVIRSEYDGSSGMNYHFQYTIDSSNDTVIGGMTYRYLQDNYLREDSMARQVYYLDPSTGHENILYDFNAQVGDSFVVSSPFFSDTALVYVVSVDSVVLEGTERTRIALDFSLDFEVCPNMLWIEGMGSSFAPFWRGLGDCWHIQFNLGCYRLINSPVTNPIYGNICSPVSNPKSKPVPSEIVLYPNPTREFLTIESTGKNTNSTVIFYNTMGQEVWSGALNQKLVLNVSDWQPKGIYLVKIIAENGKRIEQQRIVMQ